MKNKNTHAHPQQCFDFSATDFISEDTSDIYALRMLTRLHVVIGGNSGGCSGDNVRAFLHAF